MQATAAATGTVLVSVLPNHKAHTTLRSAFVFTEGIAATPKTAARSACSQAGGSLSARPFRASEAHTAAVCQCQPKSLLSLIFLCRAAHAFRAGARVLFEPKLVSGSDPRRRHGNQFRTPLHCHHSWAQRTRASRENASSCIVYACMHSPSSVGVCRCRPNDALGQPRAFTRTCAYRRPWSPSNDEFSLGS